MMAAATAPHASLAEVFAGTGLQLPDLELTGMTTHSGQVTTGGLFIACRGAGGHGLEYLEEALRAGPAAVAWEPVPGMQAPKLPDGVLGIRLEGLGAQVGAMADRYFGRPSAQLRVTGVTGTNGKTTTAWLVATAMQRLGRVSAYMGTLGYGIGGALEPSALTTPGVIVVHRRLRELADAGAEAVTMEVSSHALDQGRIDGVRVCTAAFTNLSRDHLDYHGSFAAYREAKAKLFAIDTLESAVINIGDAFGAELASRCAGHAGLLTVAPHDSAGARKAALTAELLHADRSGLQVRLTHGAGQAVLRSPLWGTFNVENLLVAAGILLAEGYALQEAAAALADCTAPAGRMQRAGADRARPLVVVDFAHTPDALDKALRALRAHCDGAVWLVFGCGGDRDQGKRAEMGAIAAAGADAIIVTNDNPRFENPQEIIGAILAGMPQADRAVVIPDRAEAIRTAIAQAGLNDAVLIAGKGSESSQSVRGHALPFSDLAVATAALEARP